MAERQPQSAQNVANQYDDDAMVPADADAVIPWAEARGRLAEGRSFWWATTRRDGRPHVRPVLAVLLDDVIYSTTNRTARKAKNLAANPACAITVSTDDIDFMIEGTAAPSPTTPRSNVSRTTPSTAGPSPCATAHSTHRSVRRPPARPRTSRKPWCPKSYSDWAPTRRTHCARPVGASERGLRPSRRQGRRRCGKDVKDQSLR